MDGLILVTFVPGIVFSLLGDAFRLWTVPVIGPNGEILCDEHMNMWSAACFPELYQIGALELAGVILSILVL